MSSTMNRKRNFIFGISQVTIGLTKQTRLISMYANSLRPKWTGESILQWAICPQNPNSWGWNFQQCSNFLGLFRPIQELKKSRNMLKTLEMLLGLSRRRSRVRAPSLAPFSPIKTNTSKMAVKCSNFYWPDVPTFIRELFSSSTLLPTRRAASTCRATST